jgi:hypothetical protein
MIGPDQEGLEKSETQPPIGRPESFLRRQKEDDNPRRKENRPLSLTLRPADNKEKHVRGPEEEEEELKKKIAAAGGGKTAESEAVASSGGSRRSSTSTVLTGVSKTVRMADISGIPDINQSKTSVATLTEPVTEPPSSSFSPRRPRPRPTMPGYWQCSACDREVQHGTWGDSCPDCGHTRCKYCTWYERPVRR